MTSIKPSILRSVSPGKRAACDGVFPPRVTARAADAKSSANRVVSGAISEGRFIPREVVRGYNDDAVRWESQDFVKMGAEVGDFQGGKVLIDREGGKV